MFGMALDAHIVSHTHWDREWYHPVERFQQRLVALVDELIADPPRDDESFLLDGQAIVVEDYLSIRPDRAADLSALLSLRRLEAGPWYVLADELIPGGEALVRNLFAGRRSLARFNATIPHVLYCPDSFGHPAALPSIAAGFGLPLIILWRGYGGPRWPAGDAVRWSAPNGDTALLYHLPRDGYEFGSHLPSGAVESAARWERMRAELEPRSTTSVVLIPNGADHHARQQNLDEAVVALGGAARSTGDSARRSSLRQFGETLVSAAAKKDLPVVRGELRDSHGYTWTLQGTFATRAAEKRMNAAAEQQLVRDVEPWAALASYRGATTRPLVEAAWRTLLSAHPHDTLCGCSIDDVASAMELRIRSARNQAEGIRDDSILRLIGHDPVAARGAKEQWQPALVVRNPSARTRSGVAVIQIEQFLRDVPVGPGSAPAVKTLDDEMAPPPGLAKNIQLLSQRDEYSLTESPCHYPDNDLVRVTTYAAWVDKIGAYAISCQPIEAGDRVSDSAPGKLSATKTSVSNDAIAVGVTEQGNIWLEDIATKRRIESLIDFIDDVDMGDLYTSSPRPRPFDVTVREKRMVVAGPLRGEFLIRFAIATADPEPRALADVSVSLVLDFGSPFVRVRVTGENHAPDHRLRMVFRSDLIGARTWADAAFGPVLREKIVISGEEAKIEAVLPTAPLHRYVSVFSDAAGATVFSDGLAEYETRDDGSMIVTLVRGVGDLSRNDIPERPGHAGWPRPTPAAQCLGPFAAEFAFMLHGSRSRETIHDIECAADDVVLPIVGTTLRAALSIPASPVKGVELDGIGLGLSAIKESEDGEWLVLRCINLCEEPTVGEWILPFDVHEARQSRLDETPTTHIAFKDRTVPILAAPRDIVTILVR
ncbi:MAG: glycosyl hydrolase-related protein [Gemmatimonadaceae bacterium]